MQKAEAVATILAGSGISSVSCAIAVTGRSLAIGGRTGEVLLLDFSGGLQPQRSESSEPSDRGGGHGQSEAGGRQPRAGRVAIRSPFRLRF